MTYPPRASDESLFTLLDTAEQFILERVRQSVRQAVTEKLLAEFNELIQEEISSALSDIVFSMCADKDPFNRTEDVRVLVEWIKCREQKRKFRTRSVIEEEG